MFEIYIVPKTQFFSRLFSIFFVLSYNLIDYWIIYKLSRETFTGDISSKRLNWLLPNFETSS